MKRNEPDAGKVFDKMVERIQAEPIDEKETQAATARVWAKINTDAPVADAELANVARIETCSDFQALLPAYVKGRLSESRALLVGDHVRDCVPCRKALREAREGKQVSARPAASAKPATILGFPRRTVLRGAIAASLVAALSVLPFADYLSPFGSPFTVTVEAADGDVFRVLSTDISKIAPGDRLDRGQRVRTGRDAGAMVKLGNGATLEMRERSEFSVHGSTNGISVRLDRGDVIVRTASASDSVFVVTPDALVTVDQGVASVSNATKGTRVSSLAGNVSVVVDGSETRLEPGRQVASTPAIEPTRVADEIAWSRESSELVKQLQEVSALRNDIDSNVARPGVRTSMHLVDQLPAGTVFFASIPNLTNTLVESHKLVQERVEKSPALKAWWDDSGRSGDAGHDMQSVLGQLQEFGSLLGEEITVGVRNGAGDEKDILVLADVKDPAALRGLVEGKMKLFGAGTAVTIADSASSALAAAKPGAPAVWIEGNVLGVSTSATALDPATLGSFAGTPFHARIAEVYKAGAGIVVAADLEAIARAEAPKAKGKRDAYSSLGLSDLRYFVVEDRGITGQGGAKAVLSFAENHRGITSWLAAPGPIGALEYVSPDAPVLTAFVVEKPAVLAGDLFKFVSDLDPEAFGKLRDFEAKHGVNLRADFAEPLGGEFAFTVDGPLLPVPAWKMVFEVYDTNRMQQSFEKTVDLLNKLAAENGKQGFTLQAETVGDRMYYVLRATQTGTEIHYTFADGYLIVAGSRALVSRAIQFRETGYTILRSPRFTSVLPADGSANFSALFYHDLGRIVGQVMENAPVGKDAPALQALGSNASPTLVYAYALPDRIEIAANTDKGAFGLSPSTLVGLPGEFGLSSILGNALSGK